MNLDWRKSTFSAAGSCVEVAEYEDEILIRESDQPGEFIRTSKTKLKAFIKGVKAGEFDNYAA